MHPTEAQIQDKFFKQFLTVRNCVRVKNWTGWSYRKGKDHYEEKKFYREFDLAIFYKDARGLTLEGYEVKGWRRAPTKEMRERMAEPAFGDGIDQALALLQQGADFSRVIYPEPTDPADKTALSELWDHYAQNIGIIYVRNDLSSYFDYLRNRTRTLQVIARRKCWQA